MPTDRSSFAFLPRGSCGWLCAVTSGLAAGFALTLLLIIVLPDEEVTRWWLPLLSGLVAGAVAGLYWQKSSGTSWRRKALNLTDDQFQELASNVPGVIFQWSDHAEKGFGFNYCSPRCEEFFGFKAEDALQDWSVINIHPNDAGRWAESVRHSSETLEDWFFEGRLLSKQGDVYWWRGIAKPVRVSEKEVLFNGIMLDISEAKEAEREIHQARMNAEKLGTELLLVNQSLNETNAELKRINQQKNEFLGVAAHDLKNPLGGIVGFAGAMRISLEEGDLYKERSELIEMADSIEQSSRHMLHIINELLNTSVLESQGMRLDCVKTDLNLIVRNVVQLNQATARRKNIEIICTGEDNCIATIDPQKVQELADNLLSNAIKYSPARSKVWVDVRSDGNGRVAFSVKDQGPGLTEDDKKRIFGKFQKLSARPTGGESSTGLGLSICKSIVDLHGGRIWAESEQGNGSRFCVELPLKPLDKTFISDE